MVSNLELYADDNPLVMAQGAVCIFYTATGRFPEPIPFLFIKIVELIITIYLHERRRKKTHSKVADFHKKYMQECYVGIVYTKS